MSHRQSPDGKDTNMKIRFRYDNEFQTIEMNVEDAMGKWLSVDLEEDLTEEEIEKRVQEAVDEQYNKPEYNNTHKFWRHRGYSKAKAGKGLEEDDIDGSEPLMKEVRDDRIFRRDELSRAEREEYDATCQKIRAALARKPEWAEIVIAVCIDGGSIKNYAARKGVSASSISHKLSRAKKKLREVY